MKRVMGVTLTNLTPHAITILPDGRDPVIIAPSGTVARVTEIMTDEILDPVSGLRFVGKRWGAVEGLPARVPGIISIVSTLVAQAVGDERSDLVTPHDLVRDDEGRVIGCRALAWATRERS